jgi:carbon starvation protein
MAIAFGLLLKHGKLTLGQGSLIFVPLVFLALFAAAALPILPGGLPTPFGAPKYFWIVLLLVYCFAASVLPVWFMLQPRDYLSSYLLFACLVFGGLGMLIGSLGGALPAQWPHFTEFRAGDFMYLFPVLFITVACGACSGFHSIVASGTTAKQLPAENAARPVAYGGMLTEAALALVALATVMVLADLPAGQSPIVTFSQGMGRFLGVFGLPAAMGATFGLMAISTFLLTTLDTCTRLTRYIVEEFFDIEQSRKWRYATTALALAPLLYFCFKTYEVGGMATPAWKVIWPAFGTTNQLLGALSLLVITVWRRSQGRSVWFVLWPMLFMLTTTTISMAMLIVQHAGPGGTPVISWINGAMLAMTALLVADTALNWGKLGRQGLAAGLAAAETSLSQR